MIEDETRGPFSEDDIAELIRARKIKPRTPMSSPAATNGNWAELVTLDFSKALQRYDAKIEHARQLDEAIRAKELQQKQEEAARKKAERDAREQLENEARRQRANEELIRREELQKQREAEQASRPVAAPVPGPLPTPPSPVNHIQQAFAMASFIVFGLFAVAFLACMGVCSGAASRHDSSSPSYHSESPTRRYYRQMDELEAIGREAAQDTYTTDHEFEDRLRRIDAIK